MFRIARNRYMPASRNRLNCGEIRDARDCQGLGLVGRKDLRLTGLPGLLALLCSFAALVQAQAADNLSPCRLCDTSIRHISSSTDAISWPAFTRAVPQPPNSFRFQYFNRDGADLVELGSVLDDISTFASLATLCPQGTASLAYRGAITTIIPSQYIGAPESQCSNAGNAAMPVVQNISSACPFERPLNDGKTLMAPRQFGESSQRMQISISVSSNRVASLVMKNPSSGFYTEVLLNEDQSLRMTTVHEKTRRYHQYTRRILPPVNGTQTPLECHSTGTLPK